MTIWLVRHAKAGNRSSWSSDDGDRPLVAKGRDQADALVALLAGEPITRVLTSPALRCQQTIAPLAHALGLTLELHDALAEGRGPRAALELIDGFVADGMNVVLCSHGDVIPEALDQLAHRGVLLDERGACAKGSTWQLHVHDATLVRATYTPPR